MSLLAEFLAIVRDWRDVFPQQRTFQRAVRQALGSLVCLGRRCLSRIIWAIGGQNRSWSAEYFLHSRCQWEPPATEDRTLDPAGVLSTRSLVAAVSCQPRSRFALSAGFAFGAAAPHHSGRRARLADPF
jgi:hypothetical protein